MNIPNGKHTARAVNWALGLTNGGKEQVAVTLEIMSEGAPGEQITWFGFFTEKTEERTLDSLRYMGWTGNDISDLSEISHPDTAKDVQIVVEAEEYNGEWRPKVQWVNKIGSGAALKNQMDASQMRAFAARLKGKAAAHAQRMGVAAGAKPAPRQAPRPAPVDEPPPHDDDDVPF